MEAPSATASSGLTSSATGRCERAPIISRTEGTRDMALDREHVAGVVQVAQAIAGGLDAGERLHVWGWSPIAGHGKAVWAVLRDP